MTILSVSDFAKESTVRDIEKHQINVEITKVVGTRNPLSNDDITTWVGIDTQLPRNLEAGTTLKQMVNDYLVAAENCTIDDVLWMPVSRVINEDQSISYLDCNSELKSIYGVTGFLYVLISDLQANHEAIKDDIDSLMVFAIDGFYERINLYSAWVNGEVYKIKVWPHRKHDHLGIEMQEIVYHVGRNMGLYTEHAVNSIIEKTDVVAIN